MLQRPTQFQIAAENELVEGTALLGSCRHIGNNNPGEENITIFRTESIRSVNPSKQCAYYLFGTVTEALTGTSIEKTLQRKTIVVVPVFFRFSPRAGGEKTFFSPPEFSFFFRQNRVFSPPQTAFSPRECISGRGGEKYTFSPPDRGEICRD